MNKNHSPYIYIYIVLAFMLLIASCDKPQSENKATSSSSVDTENGGGTEDGEAKPEPVVDGDDGEANPEPVVDGDDGDDGGAKPKPEAKPEHSFSFLQASPRIARTETSYTQEVTEAHKPTDDDRTIAYSSSNDDIATVDDKGVVTFKTAGIVTIKAEKQTKGKYVLRSAQYTLYITIKLADNVALAKEIEKATRSHGGTVDLNYIDTSAITNMGSVFYDNTTFNGDISKWDVSQVTNMESMFNASAFNGDISKWDVSQVTNMISMFEGTTAFNGDISEWNVSRVIDMEGMFDAATAFNGDISEWNVSQVTDMEGMFDAATAFNGDISEWKVSKVIAMSYMFLNATAFTQNLESWGKKLHSNIKDNMENAKDMFKNSGVAPVPRWCTGVCDHKPAR